MAATQALSLHTLQDKALICSAAAKAWVTLLKLIPFIVKIFDLERKLLLGRNVKRILGKFS